MGVVKSRGIRMAQHVESTERESPFVGCREHRRLHIDGNGYHRMEPGGDAHRRDPVRAQPLDRALADELDQALNFLDDEDDLWCGVLTGAGSGFGLELARLLLLAKDHEINADPCTPERQTRGQRADGIHRAFRSARQEVTV